MSTNTKLAALRELECPPDPETVEREQAAQAVPADYQRGWDACMSVWADHMKRMKEALEKPLPRGWANHAHHIQKNVMEVLAAAPAAPAPEAAQAVPAVGSPEASALIDSELAAYGWPANPRNAARVGYEACRKLMQAAPAPEAQPYRMSAGEADAMNRALARSVRFVDEAQAAGQELPNTEAVTACWQDFGRTEEFRRAVKWSQDGEIPGALFVAFRAGLRAASPKALAQRQPLTEPPPGLLMSMAIRYDHGLGCPGYYDSELFKAQGVTHAQRLEGTLRTMRQLWEEVTGRGFYSPEREAEYAKLAGATTGEQHG